MLIRKWLDEPFTLRHGEKMMQDLLITGNVYVKVSPHTWFELADIRRDKNYPIAVTGHLIRARARVVLPTKMPQFIPMSVCPVKGVPTDQAILVSLQDVGDRRRWEPTVIWSWGEMTPEKLGIDPCMP